MGCIFVVYQLVILLEKLLISDVSCDVTFK
jgi:hypothetical protein